MEIVLNDAVLAAADAVNELYEVHAAGGSAHIVTDDWNLENHSIEFCIGYAKDEGDDIALDVLHLFKELRVGERATALAIFDGYLSRDGVLREDLR